MTEPEQYTLKKAVKVKPSYSGQTVSLKPRTQYVIATVFAVALGVGLCALDWHLTGY